MRLPSKTTSGAESAKRNSAFSPGFISFSVLSTAPLLTFVPSLKLTE